MTDRAVIALALFFTMFLLGVLGRSAGTDAQQAAEEQRLQNVTAQLRSSIETDLRVGLALADNDDAQRLLEDVAAHTAELDSIEIDSDQGLVLFASDRVLRGQSVPPAWRAAMLASPSGWHTFVAGSHSAATALRDASGQIAGYLVWIHEDDDEQAARLFGPTFWIAIAIAIAALIVPWILDRLADERPHAVPEAGSFEQAVSRVESASLALERANHDVHALAGIEP